MSPVRAKLGGICRATDGLRLTFITRVIALLLKGLQRGDSHKYRFVGWRNP